MLWNSRLVGSEEKIHSFFYMSAWQNSWHGCQENLNVQYQLLDTVLRKFRLQIVPTNYSPNIGLNFFPAISLSVMPGFVLWDTPPLKFCMRYLFPSPSYKVSQLYYHRCRCGNNSKVPIDSRQVSHRVLECFPIGFFPYCLSSISYWKHYKRVDNIS